jgi:ABC-type phosphate transport system substrate-binding protein
MITVKQAVRCAIAVAIAGTAAQAASALDISAYDSSVTNVYISGSTALDNTIVNSAIELAGPGGLCQSGTVDIYYIGTTSSYSNRMIFCSASGTSGITAGNKLAVFKESSVGSANGVQPLILAAKGQPTGLNFINPAAISDATCSTAATVAATNNFSSYVQHSGCPTTAVTPNSIPTGGFSDVEAAILRTPSNGTINAADASTYLSSSATLDQVWAVALTKNAYYALQSAEGLTTPSDDPANTPTLSKEEIAGLISGNMLGWSQLGLSPTDDTVYVCRRDNGSGTEASFEAYFLGERCSLSSESVPAENATNVWANGSGGGVRACLQHMYAGGTQTAYYSSATHTFSAGQQYAIGFLNTEITASNLSGAGDSFRLVAVDGVRPTIANVQNGFYPYFSTGLAYQVKKGSNIPSGNALAAFNAITAKIGHPTWTSDSNKAYSGTGIPWGVVGDVSPAPLYAATNGPPNPATSTTAATNPTNAYTKASSGSINNCDLPVLDTNDLISPYTPAEASLLGTGVVNN